MDDFVARKSIVRLTGLLALSVGFVVLGLWIAGAFGFPPSQGRVWAGWLAIVVFGVFGIVAAARIFGPVARLKIDAEGIWWAQWSDKVIPWATIKSFEVRTVQRQRFVSLRLLDPASFRSTRLMRFAAVMNCKMGYGDIAISLAGTDAKLDDLVATIRRHNIPELQV